MKVFTLNTECDLPVCLALGFFDCVHRGHAALISKTVALAKEKNALSCVMTFADNPYPFLSKGEKLIFTFSERTKLFESAGVQAVFAVPFSKELMQTPKQEFLNLITSRLNVKGVVCGYDYKFGTGAEGDTEYLASFCNGLGISCNVVPPVMYNGLRVSSTLIKSKLLCGDIEQAAELLEHSYFIEGEVCHGRGVGRLFDFPTANVDYGSDKLLPKDGVYATVSSVDGKKYKSVTNVGNKPTFNEYGATVETMLSEFGGDLYGKLIRVEFVRRLRDIKKFATPQELKNQIYSDASWR